MKFKSFYHTHTGGLLALVLLGCGGSEVVAPPPPPPPVTTGTLFFALDNSRCPSYTTAEYVSDSVTVGTESVGPLSKGYTVPSGSRSAKARLTKPGSSSGLWTFNTQVTVPDKGNVTAHLSC